MKIKSHKFVSEQEFQKLIKSPKHRLFFTKVIIPLSETLPENVFILITSIDKNAFTGAPRIVMDPKVSHYDSHAVDYTFVEFRDKSYHGHLPIPLNRNKLLADYIKLKIIESGCDISQFPLIALESDHIHSDDIRPSMFIYYNEIRPTFDKNVSLATFVAKGLNVTYERII